MPNDPKVDGDLDESFREDFQVWFRPYRNRFLNPRALIDCMNMYQYKETKLFLLKHAYIRNKSILFPVLLKSSLDVFLTSLRAGL